jgi:hypothetical protein
VLNFWVKIELIIGSAQTVNINSLEVMDDIQDQINNLETNIRGIMFMIPDIQDTLDKIDARLRKLEDYIIGDGK